MWELLYLNRSERKEIKKEIRVSSQAWQTLFKKFVRATIIMVTNIFY
jgi:hypothetical protein